MVARAEQGAQVTIVAHWYILSSDYCKWFVWKEIFRAPCELLLRSTDGFKLMQLGAHRCGGRFFSKRLVPPADRRGPNQSGAVIFGTVAHAQGRSVCEGIGEVAGRGTVNVRACPDHLGI